MRHLDCWNFRGQRWCGKSLQRQVTKIILVFEGERLKNVNLIFLFGIFESFLGRNKAWVSDSMSCFCSPLSKNSPGRDRYIMGKNRSNIQKDRSFFRSWICLPDVCEVFSSFTPLKTSRSPKYEPFHKGRIGWVPLSGHVKRYPPAAVWALQVGPCPWKAQRNPMMIAFQKRKNLIGMHRSEINFKNRNRSHYNLVTQKIRNRWYFDGMVKWQWPFQCLCLVKQVY